MDENGILYRYRQPDNIKAPSYMGVKYGYHLIMVFLGQQENQIEIGSVYLSLLLVSIKLP